MWSLRSFLVVTIVVVVVAAAGARAQGVTAAANPETQKSRSRDTILVLDVQGDEPDNERRRLSDLLAIAFVERVALEIVSQSSVRARFDLEAEKQAAGCDTEACLAEIAGALGARYVVFSRLTRAGDMLLKIELYDAAQARGLGQSVVRAGSHDGLAAASAKGVDAVLQQAQAHNADLPQRAAGSALVEEEPVTVSPALLRFGLGGALMAVGGLALLAIPIVGLYAQGQGDALQQTGRDFEASPSADRVADVARAREAALNASGVQQDVSRIAAVTALVLGISGGVVVYYGLAEGNQ